MSDVSVILPTFNRAPTLPRAIRSVLDQTDPPDELIVVDDGSSDGTDGVVEQFDDSRIKYLRLAVSGGAGAARNAGIAQSSCRFLAFQDSDDEWLPTKLSRQLALFEASESKSEAAKNKSEISQRSVGVVYCDMTRIGKDGGRTYLQAPDVVTDALIDPVSKQYCVKNIGIISCLIKREYLLSAGGFNETLPALEDLELFIRLSRECRFARLPEALVNYHETDGISSDCMRLAKARRMLLKLYTNQVQDRWFVASELAAIACMESETADR
jgi:Glycosyltransferases involved in cell wall biogenesis